MPSEFDGLKYLVSIIKRHPVLNREKELDLTRASAKGDKRAKELLVAHNLALVISVARKFIGRGEPEERLRDAVLDLFAPPARRLAR